MKLESLVNGEKEPDENKYNDRIVGRPIRVNKQTLKTLPGKPYAEVLLFGDLHYGHKGCEIERMTAMRDYCIERNIYVLGMGDFCEAGLKSSIGDSMYSQDFNPQEQLDYMITFFEPLAKKKLLLGMLSGNHEGRILKDTGIDITKIICRTLNVPFLGYACWNVFRVGKEKYSIYAMHGSSGSKYVYTKLKAIIDISHSFDADLIVSGHVHELSDTSQLVQYIDWRSGTVKERKKFLVLTGSYVQYDDSYAQERGYPIAKKGSPKVKLFKNKKDIHISY